MLCFELFIYERNKFSLKDPEDVEDYVIFCCLITSAQEHFKQSKKIVPFEEKNINRVVA